MLKGWSIEGNKIIDQFVNNFKIFWWSCAEKLNI